MRTRFIITAAAALFISSPAIAGDRNNIAKNQWSQPRAEYQQFAEREGRGSWREQRGSQSREQRSSQSREKQDSQPHNKRDGGNNKQRQQWIKDNPEAAKKLKELRSMPREQRREAIQKWRKDNPEKAAQVQKHLKKRQGQREYKLQQIKKNNPDLYNKIQKAREKIKHLPPEQRKAEILRMKEQFRQQQKQKKGKFKERWNNASPEQKQRFCIKVTQKCADKPNSTICKQVASQCN